MIGECSSGPVEYLYYSWPIGTDDPGTYAEIHNIIQNQIVHVIGYKIVHTCIHRYLYVYTYTYTYTSIYIHIIYIYIYNM